MSTGTALRHQQAQAAALAPFVMTARVAVPYAAVVNLDDTHWRQVKQRPRMKPVINGELTVFQIDRSRNQTVLHALLGAHIRGGWRQTTGQRIAGSFTSTGPHRGPSANGTSRTCWTGGPTDTATQSTQVLH